LEKFRRRAATVSFGKIDSRSGSLVGIKKKNPRITFDFLRIVVRFYLVNAVSSTEEQRRYHGCQKESKEKKEIDGL